MQFSFAYQPIVDTHSREVISFEALVRGPHGEPSSEVFARVEREDLYDFDHACRLKAIRLAARLDLRASLNLNFFPSSSERSADYLQATLLASQRAGIPAERLVFEVAENDQLQHLDTMGGTFERYAAFGFRTAMDDFGTGFSGLRRLADHQPNYVKLDRDLVADIHLHRIKQIIVGGICRICWQLEIEPVAEGVEKLEEYRWLTDAGIHIFQGFYFARPAFESLTGVPVDQL